MRMDVYVFHPDGGPDFEVWAPHGMRRVDAAKTAGALVADDVDGFAPNLVLGHERIAADTTVDDLIAQLERDAAAQPGVEVQAGRTIEGAAGDVRVMAFTRGGVEGSGRLYQTTACLLAPLAGADGEPGDSGERDGEQTGPRERDLIYLTGTCTVEQMPTWDPAFVSAASTVRFG